MKRWAPSLLTTLLVLSTSLAPERAEAAIKDPSAAEIEKAKVLYEDGRKAYRLGDMTIAVEKFEAAYSLTENPIILYNIGLAYRRLYEESRDPAHLRRAKLVLENFRLELARDSGLGSPDEVKAVLGEVEDLLTDAETKEEQREREKREAELRAQQNQARPEGPADPEPAPPPPTTDDSAGKPMRMAGIGLIAVGGLAAIGGGVGAGLSLGKRNDQQSQLDTSIAESEDAGCPDAGGSTCDGYAAQQDVLNSNIDKARNQILIFGAGVGGAGLLMAGGGVAMFLIGRKQAADAKSAKVQVAPTWRGVSITGRF